jgi:predicted RNA-binding protein with PUA-like domain
VTKITDGNLGAWLIRCNPVIWNLAGFIEDGGEWIDNWSVVGNYRSRMMKAGDRVIFSVTGSSPLFGRGIWGIGHISGDTYDEIPEDPVADGVRYWLDEQARLAVTNGVDVTSRSSSNR